MEKKPGFAGNVQAPRYVTNEQQAQALRQLEAEQAAKPTDTLAGLAIENQWLSSAAGRFYSRATDFDTDPQFAVSIDRLKEYDTEFSAEDRDYLGKARSEQEFQARVGWIREDRQRHKELSAYGVKGVLAELTAGVFDPIGWAAGIFTGGIGTVGKVSKLGSALRTGAIVGAESAAMEAVLVASDTQRGLEDIMLATAAGVTLGAGLGAAFRKAKPEVAGAADEADVAVTDSVQDYLASAKSGPTYEDVPDLTVVSERVRLDAVKVNADIAEYTAGLEAKLSGGLRGKQKGDAKKQIRQLEQEAAEVRAEWTKHKAKVAASFGAPRNRAEAIRNESRFSSIENMYAPKLAAIDKSVKELTAKLEASDAATAAKKELASFREMPRIQQLRKMYPNGVPKLRERIETQKAAAAKVVPKPEPEPVPAADDSAGAARVKGSQVERDVFATGESAEDFITRLIDDMDDQPDPVTIRPLKWLPFHEKLQSSFATLDHSENLVNRSLNRILNENPQGGVIPKQTASILSYTYGQQIRSAVRNRVQEGWDEWASYKGHNLVEHHLDLNNTRAEFDKAVFRQVINPSDTAEPGVAQAADGLRDGFALALKIRKENGEAGFETVESNANYIPIIMDGNNINTAVSRHPKSTVLAALSLGYQTGRRKIPKKYADKIASLQYERAMSTTLSARQSFERVVSRAEEEELIESLRVAGIDESEIDALMGKIEAREEAKNISNRAKLSLGINVDAEVGGVRVIDLISTDIADLSEGYFKEAAGGAALARHGFRTEQQAMEIIDAAEKYGRNMGMNKERLADEANMLRDTISLIKGRSIEEDPTSGLASGLRMGREFTRIIRLQNLWASSFPEVARSISYLGLKTVLNAVPAVSIFRRKAGRVGAKSSGELLEPELRELEFLLGYIEEQDWVRPVSIRHEDGADGTFKSGAARVVEKALNLGSRVSNITSGFQAVQGGAGKVTTLAIKRRLMEMANGSSPIEKGLMKEVGWDDAFIDDLMKYMKANPKHVEFNGSKVDLINVEGMDPRMREALAVGIHRMAGRLIQRNFTGDSSLWMNKTLGLAMSQFRSFMLVSAEKQLVHDLRGDKIKAAQTLAWSSLLAYMSYATQVQLASFGEADRDAFINERMESRALAFGVFNKLPQTAIVSLGGDVLATLGLLPDSAYAAPGRYGFRPQTAGTVAPVLGTLGDAIGLGNSVVDLLTGDGSTEARDVAERARRLVPLANSVGIGQILKAGIGEL